MALKHCIFSLLQKYLLLPVAPPKGSIADIHCQLKDVEYRYNKHHLTATNPVHILKPNGYFRECRKHIDLSEYLQQTTKEYFFDIIPMCFTDSCTLNRGGYLLEYQLIINILQEQGADFQKFTNMGSSGNANSPLMIFHSKHDFDVIGLKQLEGKMPWDVIETFVWYSRSHIDAYNAAIGVKNGCWQTYNAQRGIATYKIAQTLGLSDIVPNTYYVNLLTEGKEAKFGSFMDVARGIHFDEYSKLTRSDIITPQLQCALTNLNILDAITYEKDHRLNNYNIVTNEEGKAIDVCAYDNDAGPTFFFSPSPVFKTYAGCQPIVKGGIINRPHLSKDTANNIQSVRKIQVYEALNGYCNNLQKWACWRRIEAIQKAIRKTIAIRPDFLIEDDKWCYNTINEELSGKYGLTYLCLLNNSFK